MTLIQFVRKRGCLISLTLLMASAVLVAIGTITTRHNCYYPVLMLMIVSNILNMFIASLELRSTNGFVLSLFDLLLCLGLFAQFLVEKFPVMSSTCWHLGIVILSLYSIGYILFLLCFRGKVSLNRFQTVVIAIHAVTPIISAVMFYCGVPAWIGLSTMVVVYMASFIYFNNILHNLKNV